MEARALKIEKVSIVVPAYNEEEAIIADLEIIKRAMAESRWDYEIIVVNDGSTDATESRVLSVEGVRLINHASNRGGGFARNTGIKASSGDVVVVTDGDGTYPNYEIPRMLEMMEERDLDMLVGARRREAGTMKVLRTPTKWFIRRLAMFMSGFNIPDLNSGLRAMKREVVLEFMPMLPWGHSWVSTITLAMLSSGYEVEFTDIDYYHRKGSSTFHPIKDTYGYLTLVIRTVTWFNPLKVFMPLIFLLGIIAVTKVVIDMVNHPFYLTANTVILVMTFIQVLVLGLLADLIAKRHR